MRPMDTSPLDRLTARPHALRPMACFGPRAALRASSGHIGLGPLPPTPPAALRSGKKKSKSPKPRLRPPSTSPRPPAPIPRSPRHRTVDHPAATAPPHRRGPCRDHHPFTAADPAEPRRLTVACPAATAPPQRRGSRRDRAASPSRTPPRLRSLTLADPAATAPSKMRHSLDYKVPQGVKQGIYYCLEEDGAAVTFCNGDMANRQEKLIRGFNHLASACNDYHEVQEWFNSVPDHVNTDLMEAKRKTYLDALQTERAAVVGLMAQILQAGAEPLPPDHMLDSDVSVILSTRGLRDAAVDAAGGQQAVESFRQSAAEYMKAAIIRNRLELIQEAEIDLNEQKDLAEKRAAEAEARLNAELQINAEGPTSAVMRRHDDAELQRQRTLQEGLEKLHAARERRRRP